MLWQRARRVSETPFLSSHDRTIMSKKYTPLTMGSVRSKTVEATAFSVTEAWFPPMSTLPPHRHERTVFAVILEGSFEDRFDSGKHLDCPPKTILTEPAEERHANRFQAKGARVLVVQPDPQKTDLLRPCARFLDRINCFSHPGIIGIAWRLVRELHHPDGVSSLSIEGLGLEMLATAARAHEPRHSAPPPWLLRAEALLNDCYLENLSVDDIACAVDVHPVHLARVFRTYFRASIGAYVRKLRLDWAVQELAVSQDPIAHVALRAGFADQSHFTRAFKTHTGFTPGSYRNALQAGT